MFRQWLREVLNAPGRAPEWKELQWRPIETIHYDLEPLEPPKPKRRKWGPDLERLSKESQRKRTRGYRME
jgi:hypothetical protein